MSILPRRCAARSSRSCCLLALAARRLRRRRGDRRAAARGHRRGDRRSDRAPSRRPAARRSPSPKRARTAGAQAPTGAARRRPRPTRRSIADELRRRSRSARHRARAEDGGLVRRARRAASSTAWRSTAIVPGFVIQGGDPLGTGSGGPGYSVVEAPPPDLKYTQRHRRDGQDRARGAGHVGQPVLHRHRRRTPACRPTTRCSGRSARATTSSRSSATSRPTRPTTGRPSRSSSRTSPIRESSG